MTTFFLLLGAIVFLILEHPVIFWLIVVPIAVSWIVSFINWLRD